MSGSQRLQAQGMTYALRRGRGDEIGVLSGFRARMFATFYETDPEALARDDEAFFGPALERGEGAFWLLEDEGGAPVGSCAATMYHLPPKPFARTGLYVYVSSMWIDPEHRRRGLGKAMLARCEAFAREHEACFLVLHPTAAGRPVYEGFGFEGAPEMRKPLEPFGALPPSHHDPAR